MSKAPIWKAFSVARMEEHRRKSAETDGASRRKGRPMRSVLSAFPLFIIPVGIYCLIAFTTSGDPVTITQAVVGGPEVVPTILTDKGSPLMAMLSEKLFGVPMIAGGTEWILTKGDALILLSIAVLFMEILKSTSTGTATIMNHAASMILFIVCLMAFLLHPNFATSVFFIITVMALLDVLAGVVVTIVSARRDFAVGEGFGG